MKVHSDFADLLQCLNDNDVKYLVVGGYAFIFYAEPRYTKDIDIWIEASPQNAQAIYAALTEFGAPLKQLEISLKDFETEGYFVQLGVPPARVDILMSIPGPSFQEAWCNRVNGKYGEAAAFFISLPDLVTAKRAAGRPQDLVDLDILEKIKPQQEHQDN